MVETQVAAQAMKLVVGTSDTYEIKSADAETRFHGVHIPTYGSLMKTCFARIELLGPGTGTVGATLEKGYYINDGVGIFIPVTFPHPKGNRIRVHGINEDGAAIPEPAAINEAIARPDMPPAITESPLTDIPPWLPLFDEIETTSSPGGTVTHEHSPPADEEWWITNYGGSNNTTATNWISQKTIPGGNSYRIHNHSSTTQDLEMEKDLATLIDLHLAATGKLRMLMQLTVAGDRVRTVANGYRRNWVIT